MAPAAARPRRRIWRKRIVRGVICLLLGAVTTVGVAWGIAALNRPMTVFEYVLVNDGAETVVVRKSRVLGSQHRFVFVGVTMSPDITPRIEGNTVHGEAIHLVRKLRPATPWEEVPTLEHLVTQGGWGAWPVYEQGYFSTARGFPMLAL